MNADAIRLNDIVTMKRIDAGGSVAMSIASTPITTMVQRAIRTPPSWDTCRLERGTYRFSTITLPPCPYFQ